MSRIYSYINNNHKLFQNFSFFFFFDVLNKLIPFFILTLVAKNISVTEFGELGIFNALSYFFVVFMSMNHYTYLSKEYYSVSFNGDILFYNLLFQNLALSIFVIVFSFLFSAVFSTGIKFPILLLAGISSLLSSLNTLVLSYFVTKQRPILHGLTNLTNSIALLISAYLFIQVYKLNFYGRIYAQIFSGVFGLLFAIPLFFKTIKPLIGKLDFQLIKKSIIWSLPLLPHTLSFWVKSGLDTLMINQFFDKEYTGIYSLILTFTSLWMIVINALFNVISPEYNKRMHQNPISFDRYKRIGVLFSLIILVILFLFYFSAIFFTTIFFPTTYLKSLEYLVLILPSLFFNAIYIFLSLYLFFNSKTTTMSFISVISASLHIILVFIFSKLHNFNYVVFVQSLSSFIMVLLLLINININKVEALKKYE